MHLLLYCLLSPPMLLHVLVLPPLALFAPLHASVFVATSRSGCAATLTAKLISPSLSLLLTLLVPQLTNSIVAPVVACVTTSAWAATTDACTKELKAKARRGGAEADECYAQEEADAVEGNDREDLGAGQHWYSSGVCPLARSRRGNCRNQ